MENLDHLLGDFKFEAKYLNRPFFFLPFYLVALYMTSNNQVLKISDSLLEYHRI